MNKTHLACAGSGNIAVGLLHVVIIFTGASNLCYLGAPGFIVTLAEEHRFLVLACLLIPLAFVFILAGAYALSSAQYIQKLPGQSVVVKCIGALYTLRGSVVLMWPFPALTQSLLEHYPQITSMSRQLQPQDWVFSCLWLIVGIIYLYPYKKTVP